MQKYKSNITTTSGAALRNVLVEVIAENGALAVLFLDREGTVPAANPLRTGADGTFYFYAVNGRYSLKTTVEGATIIDRDVVLLMDPEEITVAGPIAEAVAAAEAAATRAEEAVEDSGIPDLVEVVQNSVVDANTSAGIATEKAAVAVENATIAIDQAALAQDQAAIATAQAAAAASTVSALAEPGGAGLVGTISPLSNAVAGLVSDKLQEATSLLDFLTMGQKGSLRDGVRFDASLALQAALNSGERKILLPRQEIHVDGNLTTPSSSKFGVVVGGIEIVGQGANAYGAGRTTIVFHGTGALFKNGTDDGGAWDSGSYNGPQGLCISNVTLFAPDGTTPLSNGDGESYTPGTVALEDWKGGNIKIKNVTIMRFDKAIFAIQSDFITIEDLNLTQTHSGIYLGPRCDQAHIKDVISYHNDKSLEIDSCIGATITNYTTHGDGYGSSLPIYLKANYLRGQGASVRSTTGVTFNSLWLEHQPNELSAVDAFVGIGIDSTYPVGNVVFNSPVILNAASPTVNRVKSLAKIEKAKGVYFNLPSSPYDNTVHLDQVVEFIGSASPESVEINLGNQSIAAPWVNNGTGFPGVKVAGQKYEKYSSSSALQYGWSSDATDVYETLTISGQHITSAINTTGAGQINTETFTVVKGDVKCMEIDLTVNSGATPAFTCLSGDGATNVIQGLVRGLNKIIWTERAGGVNARMWLRNFGGSLGDWSATTQLTRVDKSTIGELSLQSPNHGGIVRSSVTNAASPTAAAATFDIFTGVPSGARLLGVRLLVETALPAGETWGASYFDGAASVIAAAGQAVAANTVVAKSHADEVTTNSPRIRITRDAGNFTGVGQISATVFYEVVI